MALESAHVGRKQAEADRAAAVAVVDAVDQRRQLLAPVIVGREPVRLMLGGRNQVEQHDADAERLSHRADTTAPARWWERGGIARCPPIPILGGKPSFGALKTVVGLIEFVAERNGLKSTIV
jgi:hypothetical protein